KKISASLKNLHFIRRPDPAILREPKRNHPMLDIQVFGTAALLSAAQIVGIGPQNAFVLRQGLARSHVLPIIAVCISCDVLLMSLGVLGVGRTLASIPGLTAWLTAGGAAFIAWLGLRSLRAALTP